MRMIGGLVGMLAIGSISAAPAPLDSWGKAGVSLNQYRQDAVECASEGYNLDISKTADAQAFVRASHQLENLPGGGNIQVTATPGSPENNSVNAMLDFSDAEQHIIDSVHPEQRFRNIKKMQMAKVDECLAQRGYSKFRLSDEQRHRLSKLKFGSDERRDYLYSLASNPAILASQKAPAQP
jgi:hypothetical protein